MWAMYDSLYRSLIKSEQFKVIIVLLHSKQPGQFNDFRLNSQNEQFFSQQNIEYILAYNVQNDKWLNLKKLKPDFIFIQTPYDCQRFEKYSIDHLNKIAKTCYIPYGFMIAAIQNMQFNLEFHHKCNRIFCESDMHRDLFYKYSDVDKKILQKQIVVTGYPKFDFYKDNHNVDASKFWKLNKSEPSQIRRLIWSPHWTVKMKKNDSAEENICFSDFHKNYQYFYKFLCSNPHIEIVLKPHPLLWDELANSEVMTKNEVMEFRKKWQALPNGSIYEKGDYFDLFMSSDAILNSSVSFLAEYYPTKKPMLFIASENSTFNECGKEIIKGLYIANDQKDIDSFIQKVVLDEDDYMYDRRMLIMKEFYFSERNSAEIIKEHLRNI